MKVCYIYQDHYPWDVRVDKITSSLAECGIATHILSRNRTGAEQFEQTAPNLTCHRLPPGRGPVTRTLLNFPAFFSPVWGRVADSLIGREKIDGIIVRDLPLAPLAVRVGRRTGCKVILDMAENYPAMIRDTWNFRGPGPADYLLRNPYLLTKMERWILPKLDGILVVSEASLQRVNALTQSTVPAWTVGNTPRLEAARELKDHPVATDIRERAGLTLLYVGGLEETRGLETVIRALPHVASRLRDVSLVIVGKGTSEPRLRSLAAELGVNQQVTITGWIDQRFVPAVIDASDICLVPHYVTEHTDTTIPNKIYDYMAQRKPVIVSNARSLLDIVELAQCGIVYPDKAPLALAHAVLKLSDPTTRRALGENGYEAIQQRLNWAHDERVLLEAVEIFDN